MIVDNGYKITYQAGNNIQLLPGFEAKPGSIFTAQIGPCEYKMDSIHLITYPPYFYPRFVGTGHSNIFDFISTGATDYVLHFYGRNGQQDINVSGTITPDHHDTSRILIDKSLWDGYECDETYTGFLSLSNCGHTVNYVIATQPRCYDDPSGKTNLNEIDSIQRDLKVKVYPNPASEVAYVNIEAEQTLGSVEIRIFDTYGKNVKADINLIVQSNMLSESINVKDLASGIYNIQIRFLGKIFNKKIIKSDI